jgi:CheY-like chemotaxis protein
LIVDDELGGRKTLEGILRPFGYDLVFATSGAEALTQAAANAPDLMVLDVMMPGMDGFEVCRRLRADPRLAEIPVIMLTALDDRESRLQGIAAGADDFISKPFDRQGTACGRASRPRLCRPGCWARWCRGTRPCAMPTRCTLMVSRPPY